MKLKDYLKESALIESRLVFLGGVLAILVLITLIRVGVLQLYQGGKFDVLSTDNRVRVMAEPPVRGRIYDRNGRLLAENRPVFTLEVFPDRVRRIDELLDDLARLVVLTPRQIARFKEEVRRGPSFEPKLLKSGLNEAEIARLQINQYRLAGVQVQAGLQRYYPYAEDLAHVLGYVGRINAREKNRIDAQAYKGTDYIGKLGIERFYEDALLGRVGFKQIESNAHGRPIRTLDREAAVAGTDLTLHLDIELQIKARELLNGRRGSVVAVDTQTGGVLAFVSAPAYDPNAFVNGIDQASYDLLRNDINRPLLNRSLYGRYAPGSTIKGLVAMAGLEAGWTPETTINCPGYYQLGNSSHRYRCWRRAGHGELSMLDSIIQSCDVYFYRLAEALGIRAMGGVLERFGFGAQTGIDLLDEPSGLVPTPEWKQAARGTVWYPGETLIAGIGQGFTLVTPLQLAVSTAMLANRGKSITPSLVQHHIDEPASLPENDLDDHGMRARDDGRFEPIIQAMQDVLASKKGTAFPYVAHDRPFSVAGKTGTAQVVAIAQDAEYDEEVLTDFQRDHALFVAFAPVDQPQIALAVVVENGGGGSSVAAPIADELLAFYFSRYSKERTHPKLGNAIASTIEHEQ